MLIKQDSKQRGDTIIEVMFAVAIFALVAVGSISIMNQGIATAQRSLEVTLVRQQIDAQAETLRYLNKAYVAQFNGSSAVDSNVLAREWENIRDNRAVTSAAVFGANTSSCPRVPNRAFALNTSNATLLTTAIVQVDSPEAVAAGIPPYAQVSRSVPTAYGIWVEAVKSDISSSTGFIDFHVRACWVGPGSNAPITIGTIVRLYEPK